MTRKAKKVARKLRGLARRTKASNERFAKLGDAEKRVAIARDVLKAIAAKQIKPKKGVYLASPRSMRMWEYSADRIADASRADPGASFKELLPTLPPCEVCAKGAIFVCAIARQNEVTAKEAWEFDGAGDDMSRMLGGIFSAEQVNTIEAEFEGETVYGDHEAIMKLRRLSPAKRMEVIMRNIIANKGTFVPVAP